MFPNTEAIIEPAALSSLFWYSCYDCSGSFSGKYVGKKSLKMFPIILILFNDNLLLR